MPLSSTRISWLSPFILCAVAWVKVGSQKERGHNAHSEVCIAAAFFSQAQSSLDTAGPVLSPIEDRASAWWHGITLAVYLDIVSWSHWALTDFVASLYSATVFGLVQLGCTESTHSQIILGAQGEAASLKSFDK